MVGSNYPQMAWVQVREFILIIQSSRQSQLV
jgi:hypothetical protein